MGKTMQEIYDTRVQGGVIRPDPAQRAVLPMLQELRQYLEQPPKHSGLRALFTSSETGPAGLYLWGGVGRGKSMLMDLFVEAVNAPKRRVHFHAFMQEIHAGLHQARRDGVTDALVPVIAGVADQVRLLAFDEMQINDITDAMIVGRLFQGLFAAGVVVVVTSNRPPDDLYKDGLNRQLFVPFIEMLKTRMVVHELASEIDYRQDLLAGRRSYFSPLNREAKQGIDAIWAELGGVDAAPLHLQVQGRDVALPKFHNGVARASFWDLCGQPLGAADYLALAKVVRVLILENVPRLGRSNFNEAKRFVTLVDTLYEAQIRLIISAEDKPQRLYQEGAGSFEFERTTSRLQEMQSEDWGTDHPTLG